MSTNNQKHLVTIVVPIYKPTLSEYEEVAFKQLFKVLGKHRIVIFKPTSLDLSNLLSNYPDCETESFSDHYFSGIAGYNRLMMSEEFYARFIDSEYILIYQLDAYVFKDELIDWCSKGYDYIGAPWLLRPIYNFPLLKFTSWIKRKYCQITNQPCSQMTRFKVGNGGLSLRKISSHIKAVTELKTITEQYLQVRHTTSIIPPRHTDIKSRPNIDGQIRVFFNLLILLSLDLLITKTLRLFIF